MYPSAPPSSHTILQCILLFHCEMFLIWFIYLIQEGEETSGEAPSSEPAEPNPNQLQSGEQLPVPEVNNFDIYFIHHHFNMFRMKI